MKVPDTHQVRCARPPGTVVRAALAPANTVQYAVGADVSKCRAARRQ